ncbi:MAG: YggT family protein [Sulfurovaceae bacterium]|nr:YggT family protein [Sulfurovaceae bacterium]
MMFLSNLINGLITLYIWVIIIVSLISIIAPHVQNPVVDVLHRITDPVFGFVREKMPFVVSNGIDFSPLVVIIGLQIIRIIF